MSSKTVCITCLSLLGPHVWIYRSVDPKKLTSYFNHCYQTGLNICVQENIESPSISATDFMQHSNVSFNASTAPFKFSFLCGNFYKKNFIYAIKFGSHPWHYFNEIDSISSEHGSLPASMDSLISKMDKVSSIDVNLNEEQTRNYYVDGKFIFKNNELKTRKSCSFFCPEFYI